MSHSWELEEEDTFSAYPDWDVWQPHAESVIPEDEGEVEEWSKWMLCFFIVASKASIFLKHLDSKWPSRLQKWQCLSVFFPLFLFSLSFCWDDF